jgi:multiple sugar transport system permease protein
MSQQGAPQRQSRRVISVAGGEAHYRRFWVGQSKWLYLLPALFILVGVVIYPLIYMLGATLFQWQAGTFGQFLGVKLWVQLIPGEALRIALINSFILAAGTVVCELAFGFVLALFLNESIGLLRPLLRAALLIPIFIAPVIVGLTWRIIFNPQYGVFAWIIGRRGFSPISEENLAMYAVILSEVWQWTPFVFVILLAALQSVPIESLESALVDGASYFTRLRYVIVPHILPAIIIALLLRSMEAFKIFDTIWVLTHAGPGRATEDMTYLIWRTGVWVSDVSSAATYSWVLVIILTALASFFLRYAYKERG